MKTFIYTIPGKPIPWARPGQAGKRRYDTQAKHKEAIGLILRNQAWKQPLLSGPLSIELRFYFKAPKQYTYHQTRPDLDNCIKFILDAANDILWEDDAQIYMINAIKSYTEEKPYTHLLIKAGE